MRVYRFFLSQVPFTGFDYQRNVYWRWHYTMAFIVDQIPFSRRNNTKSHSISISGTKHCSSFQLVGFRKERWGRRSSKNTRNKHCILRLLICFRLEPHAFRDTFTEALLSADVEIVQRLQFKTKHVVGTKEAKVDSSDEWRLGVVCKIWQSNVTGARLHDAEADGRGATWSASGSLSEFTDTGRAYPISAAASKRRSLGRHPWLAPAAALGVDDGTLTCRASFICSLVCVPINRFKQSVGSLFEVIAVCVSRVCRLRNARRWLVVLIGFCRQGYGPSVAARHHQTNRQSRPQSRRVQQRGHHLCVLCHSRRHRSRYGKKHSIFCSAIEQGLFDLGVFVFQVYWFTWSWSNGGFGARPTKWLFWNRAGLRPWCRWTPNGACCRRSMARRRRRWWPDRASSAKSHRAARVGCKDRTVRAAPIPPSWRPEATATIAISKPVSLALAVRCAEQWRETRVFFFHLSDSHAGDASARYWHGQAAGNGDHVERSARSRRLESLGPRSRLHVVADRLFRGAGVRETNRPVPPPVRRLGQARGLDRGQRVAIAVQHWPPRRHLGSAAHSAVDGRNVATDATPQVCQRRLTFKGAADMYIFLSVIRCTLTKVPVVPRTVTSPIVSNGDHDLLFDANGNRRLVTSKLPWRWTGSVAINGRWVISKG